jgi:hypothetical protein
MGCKEDYLQGAHKRMTTGSWNYKENTELAITDAYGEIIFPSAKNKKASVSFESLKQNEHFFLNI